MGDIVQVNIFNLVKPISDDVKEIEEVLESTLYFDLTAVEEGKLYTPQHPIIGANRQDGILKVEVLNYINVDASEEEKFPEWHTIEDTVLEIPLEVNLIQLEELVLPEGDKVDPLAQVLADNKALEVRLETMKRQAEDDRKQNEATTLAILELMMSII